MAGSSPMCDLLTPFWNWCTQLMPLWIAPNVITAAAALSVVVSYCVCSLVCPKLVCPADNMCVHILSALGVFLYQLFDNLDGKQARRTRSSSPLGELFDHGLDAVVMGIILIPLACSVPSTRFFVFLQFMASLTSFYFCHWEAYHTSVTYFPLVTAVVEAQCFAMTVELISAFIGIWFWDISIFGFMTLGTAFWVVAALMPTLGALQSVHNLYKSGANLFGAWIALFPFLFFAATTIFWALKAPWLLDDYPYLFFATVSLVFSYIQQRLLVQHLAKEPTQAWYPVLGVYALLGPTAAMMLTSLDTVLLSARIMLAVSVVQEVIFGTSIIWQITSFLHIRAFLIPQPQPPSQQEQERQRQQGKEKETLNH